MVLRSAEAILCGCAARPIPLLIFACRHDNLYVLLRGRKRFQLYRRAPRLCASYPSARVPASSASGPLPSAAADAQAPRRWPRIRCSPADTARMYLNGAVEKIHANGRINFQGCPSRADGADAADMARARNMPLLLAGAMRSAVGMSPRSLLDMAAAALRLQERVARLEVRDAEAAVAAAESSVAAGAKGAKAALRAAEARLDAALAASLEAPVSQRGSAAPAQKPCVSSLLNALSGPVRSFSAAPTL